MSILSWRQFPFFEGIPIKDPYYGAEGEALYSDVTVSAVCSTNQHMAIATQQVMVKLINSNIEKVLEFQCYDAGWSITKLSYFEKSFNDGKHSFLVTIAERQGSALSLKLWNLNKLLDPKYNMKKLDFNSSYHTICNISNGANNYPMTCFANSDDYSILAFGFSNGTVILVRGDLINDRGYRQRVIYENKDPITSVHFRDELTLYITTLSKVFTLSTTGKNNGHLDKTLDSKEGADIRCSVVFKEKNTGSRSLLIANKDCFQFYNSRGKSHSILMNIPKQNVHIYKNRYIVFLSHVDSNLSEVTTFANNKLVILDTKNNFIVYNHSIPNSILDIFELWDDLYMLLLDGSLLKLHEKPIKENVNILVNNELFQIAIKLIRENPTSFTEEELMNLNKKYGFYLYQKGEFNDSIDQFIQCIKLGKTSEIISKFKESSKIQYLIKYLEQMVKLKISTRNHINLLLTSYCKSKTIGDFEKFINNIEIDDDYDFVEEHKKFDLDQMIQLCNDNEYYSLALLIAKKFNLALKVVAIQLDNMKDPVLTITYIKSLPIDDLLRVLVDNVSQLLNLLPNETTQLLIDVFTGKYKPKLRDLETDIVSETEKDNESKSISSYPLFTSYKQFASFMDSKKTDKSRTASSSDNDVDVVDVPTYQPPKPRIIFSSFANHNYEFVIFLEACIESYDNFGGSEQDKNDIINTLYEIYLVLSKDDDTSQNSTEWKEKAKKLLLERKNFTEEDKNLLLLISSMYDFGEGEIIIRELTDDINSSIDGFELDLFRSAVFSHNIEKSFEIVTKYGAKEPELYRLALITYSSNNSYLETIGDDRMKELLESIEKLKILTPLEVLDCLTHGSANVKLGLVKEYLLRNIEAQKKEITSNENLMNAYELKLNDLTNQIDDLLNEPKTLNSTTCSVCSNQLNFPIVYFKCGHQIHESCLIESNGVKNSSISNVQTTFAMDDKDDGFTPCPICSTEQDALMMLKKQQEDVALRYDLFKSNLKGSTDKFKAMFTFLGRGGMEPAKVVVNGSVPK